MTKEEMAEILRKMRKEMIKEAEKHLAKMEKMHKAHGDISFLCESVCEKMAKIDMLQSRLIQGVEGKLRLHGIVRELEVIIRDRECVADELRAEVEDLDKRI